jgi:hypothetical protein
MESSCECSKNVDGALPSGNLTVNPLGGSSTKSSIARTVSMTEQSDRLVQRKRRDYFAVGLSLGIALGLLWGTALGNSPIGLVIGVAVGVALGVVMREAASSPAKLD